LTRASSSIIEVSAWFHEFLNKRLKFLDLLLLLRNSEILWLNLLEQMIVGLLQREILHVVDVLLHRGVGDLAWGADLRDHFGVDYSDLIQVVSVDAVELGEFLRELQS
jgi:hypothetical protein